MNTRLVAFELYLNAPDGSSFVPEDQIEPSQLSSLIRSGRTDHGLVAIEAPGQPRFQIADELIPAAHNLLRCVPELLRTGSSRYSLFSSCDELTLLREGDVVRVSLADEPDIEVPAVDLLPALVDCSSRILTLFSALEGYAPAVDFVRPAEAEAREALLRAGLTQTEGPPRRT